LTTVNSLEFLKLPIEYANNTTAWVTASVFEDYLHNWDSNLARKGKKITALVMDNCPSQPPQPTVQ
jgi:hypothetical protein